jgi:hypothetical protein
MEVWEGKCASCHGVFGESNEVFSALVGGTTDQDIKTGRVANLTRFSIDWVWDGKPALVQSRATDDTGQVQPTYAQLRAVRGTRSIYHNNSIQTWLVQESGEVKNVQLA